MNKAKQYLLDKNLPDQVVNNNKGEFHDKKNLIYTSDVMTGFADKKDKRIEKLEENIKVLSGGFVNKSFKVSILNNVFECMASLTKNIRTNSVVRNTITKKKLVKMICELYDMADKALKETP